MGYYNGKKVLSVAFPMGRLGVFDSNEKPYGTYYPKNENLEGYNKVIFNSKGFDKLFVEGSGSIKEYGIDEGITNICAYAFSGFTALEKVIIYNTQQVITIDPNAFINTPIETNDGDIYVQDNLLSAYQNAYPNWSFKAFSTYGTWEVPYIEGETSTTLTSEYLTEQINKLTSYLLKESITKVIIPTYFTNESANSVVWSYDFSAFVNLNNNIWYGATQYDFSTWTIEGSGTLTSAIVESSINSISSDRVSSITKVVIPNSFTTAENGALDIIDEKLSSNLSLITYSNFGTDIYSKMNDASNKFIYWEYNYGQNVTLSPKVLNIQKIRFTNAHSVRYGFLSGTIGIVIFDKNVNTNQYDGIIGNRADVAIFNGNTIQSGSILLTQYTMSKAFFPNATTMNGSPFGSVYYHRAPKKLFMGQDNCSLGGVLSGNVNYLEKIYIPVTGLTNYMVVNNWSTYSAKQVGVIDGGEIYKTYDYDMNYPKLTGIDTESNIQLLTPAEDSLYLASDTGNLWQYSGGVWTNLFSGYINIWFSEEDCNTAIDENNMNTSETYYVKLYNNEESFNISSIDVSHDKLVKILNALGTPSTTKTLTMGEQKLALLSQNEINIALNKNWTLA